MLVVLRPSCPEPHMSVIPEKLYKRVFHEWAIGQEHFDEKFLRGFEESFFTGAAAAYESAALICEVKGQDEAAAEIRRAADITRSVVETFKRTS